METFTFTASDNIDIYVYKWVPEQVKAVVQIVHGAVEHAKRYDEFAKYLNEAGYAVYATDHRGHGQTGTKSNQFNLFSQETNGWLLAIEDLVNLTNQIKVEHPDLPLFMFGHSMGSFLTRDYISQRGTLVQGVILSGTGYTPPLMSNAGIGLAKILMLRGRDRPSNILHHLIFGELNKQMDNPRTDYDFLSRDPALVNAYINDPWCGQTVTAEYAHEMLTGIARINRPQAFADTPKTLPIYLFSGVNDPVGGTNASGVHKVTDEYQRAGIQDLSLKLYENGRHEMLNEINKEEVMADVVAWLNAHA